MSTTRRIPLARAAPWTLPVVLWMAAGLAWAQPGPDLGGQELEVVHLVGDEQTLWLARVGARRSQVCRREVSASFRPIPALKAPIANAAASQGLLFAFTTEGAFYSATSDGWSRELDLPRRARPLDMVRDGAGVLVLVESPAAGSLPLLVGDTRPPTSQPFDPGDAPFSVIRFDNQGWVAVARCPLSLGQGGQNPLRIGLIEGVPWLAWPAADRACVEYTRLDITTGQWLPAAKTPLGPNITDFWITTLNRLPTIVISTTADDGGQQPLAYRLFGDPADHDWRTTPLELSDLPEGALPARYSAAFGFNQHLALLMLDQSATAHLRFGHTDARPAEATVPASQVFKLGDAPGPTLRWIHGATLMAPFIALLALFVFRRGALAADLSLPAESLPALTFQRLLGWLIDLAPFAVAGAEIIGVDWRAGLQELFGWAAGSDAAEGRLPAAGVLLWWGLTCGSHTAYSMIMELLTRRTVGKVLTGTRLLCETGTPPTVWQVVVRNLLRLAEMTPPLWVLGFLVVLSRNRQRFGDIFARTVVVRRARSKSP